jgi:methyl coenzyme M reductase subunit C
VICGHLDCLSVSADDASRVTGVGHQQLLPSEQRNNGRAARIVSGLKLKEIVRSKKLPNLNSNIRKVQVLLIVILITNCILNKVG